MREGVVFGGGVSGLLQFASWKRPMVHGVSHDLITVPASTVYYLYYFAMFCAESDPTHTANGEGKKLFCPSMRC
jgi:hypothetical protein